VACHRISKSALERCPHLLLLCVVVAGLLLSGSCLGIGALPYQIAGVDSKDKAEELSFDISPQPLLSALRQYSEVTGQAVLFDDAMTVGVRSGGVHGDFNKVDALLKLLMGTGLTASYSSDQAFTLKVADPGVHASTNSPFGQPDDAGDGSEGAIGHYAARIQKPIELALCRFPETQLGSYRLALQLWITPDGRVKKTRILSDSTAARKTLVLRALDQLALDAPPSTMPQPLTVLLTPQSAASGFDCPSTDRVAQ
jgi:hypothetical protein